MTTSEEETYSVMFSSLRHPARRKILRMLSEEKMTFSQMLETLEIPSSHLTYHLENLGELVIKDENGKYELSSFGKAAVSLMKGAEEVPETHTKRFSALPLRWKTLYAFLIIAIVLLGTLSLIQFNSFNNLSNNYSSLQKSYSNIKLQNEDLLLSNTTDNAAEAKTTIQDVLQIDTSKYQMTLLSDTVQVRTDLGGMVEEIMQYSLTNAQSQFDLTLRFRDGHFSLFQISQIEGYPSFPLVYSTPQPTDIIQACQGLLKRYEAAFNYSYLGQVNDLIASANDLTTNQALGNTNLQISSYNGVADITLMYTADGTNFQAKSLNLVYNNYGLTQFSDDWFLYSVGSTVVNITQAQAVQIALNAVKTYSYNMNGTRVSNFDVLSSPVSAELYPKPRANNLTLYPYWYVTLHLSKTYPGGVNEIGVGVWADTGQPTDIQAISTS
ncbi:MAG TPA: winged helix-turn-helix domain-containing protein [Candidatus Limnocylindrales bacterium]|nr:winged helix-turn-helix domain-containing protein [Candidatus Limnocylindrales bacterium]